jgi:hypothetical protein
MLDVHSTPLRHNPVREQSTTPEVLMISAIRARLSYGNVIATLALFVALGGAAYAATKAPKNSVGTKSIKNNAVKTKKIADAAVTLPKLGGTVLTDAIKITHVDGPAITVPDSESRQDTVTCPAGSQAIAGEVTAVNPTEPQSDMGLISSFRVPGNPAQWVIRMGNEDDSPRSWQLGAICISGVG